MSQRTQFLIAIMILSVIIMVVIDLIAYTTFGVNLPEVHYPYQLAVDSEVHTGLVKLENGNIVYLTQCRNNFDNNLKIGYLNDQVDVLYRNTTVWLPVYDDTRCWKVYGFASEKQVNYLVSEIANNTNQIAGWQNRVRIIRYNLVP